MGRVQSYPMIRREYTTVNKPSSTVPPQLHLHPDAQTGGTGQTNLKMIPHDSRANEEEIVKEVK